MQKPLIKHQDKILIEKILRRVPIFRNLPEKRIKKIIDDFTVRDVKKNKTVVFQSDKSTDLYLVLIGKVKAELLDPEGNELVLTTFNEGEFFGEMSLIDGKPRSAAVLAEEDSSVGILKRERFMSAVRQDPMITFELLAALTERLRKADEMIEALAFLDVRERLLKFLVNIIRQEGKQDKNGEKTMKLAEQSERKSINLTG